jgi:hypothetical protein
MSEAPGYEVGQVVNGHRWTGHEWLPVDADAVEPAGSVPAASEVPPTGAPLLGSPQFGGPEYGAPQAEAAEQSVNQFGTPIDPAQPIAPPYGAPAPAFATGGPTPFAAAAPMFLLGVLVAIGVSVAGIMVINSRGGGVLWWGGYFVTFALWRRAFASYKAVSAASGTGLGGLGTAVAAVGVVLAVGAAAAFGLAFANDKSAPALAETVGSCWTAEGEKVFLVACDSADAQYTALEEVTSEADCPTTAIGSIETATAGRFLCLGLK